MDMDCVFCRIVNNEIPRVVHMENDAAIVFDSNDPVAEHHYLVVPKVHIGTFLDLASLEGDILAKVFDLAKNLITEKHIDNAYKLGINGGEYQTVGHFHLHVLGGKLKEGKVT